MIRLAPLLLAILASCGVAGPPIPPSQVREDAPRAPVPPNVLVSGTIGVGVGGRF